MYELEKEKKRLSKLWLGCLILVVFLFSCAISIYYVAQEIIRQEVVNGKP